MRLPIIPILVAVILLGGVVYLFNSSADRARVMDAPRLTRLADIDGVESEVANAPDGKHYAVIADGALWLLDLTDGSRRKITDSPEAVTFPAWSPDGRQVTFTRGTDTFVLQLDAATGDNGKLFKQNATELSWSPGGRLAFIRDRALWLADASGRNEKLLVSADPNSNIAVHVPRFSPDSLQLAFIKSLLNIRGEVWTVDALNGKTRAIVNDRIAENPTDSGWLDANHLVYLTDRSGAYALWQIDFEKNVNTPITQPLFSMPLCHVGIAVSKDRIVIPRHFENSDIELSDGTVVAKTDNLELEPAASPDGKTIAYTVLKDNKSEIWTADIDGRNGAFHAEGREARFTPDGFHLVYTYTDLNGNEDIWRVDLRNGAKERLTDADEIDLTPDASPDGSWITFTSGRGVEPSVWILPASGGKRLRITDGGYGPRFSRDSKSILFWNQDAFWRVDPSGGNLHEAIPHIKGPAAGVWSNHGPVYFNRGEIRNETGAPLYQPAKPIWPRFDALPDGRWVIAPIDVRETALWAVDLVYVLK